MNGIAEKINGNKINYWKQWKQLAQILNSITPAFFASLSGKNSLTDSLANFYRLLYMG
ncbi:MAG: hypothetical protein HC877_19490 [Thioploca sp.]|nr:hypothetical protein [Thioploca sp.]